MGIKKILFLLITAILLIVAIVAASFLWRGQKTESYTVTFKDYDGTILKTEIVKVGESASTPENPKREGYIFAGWDKSFTGIIKDTIVMAEYIRITETTFVVDTITARSGAKKVEVKASVMNNPGILGMVFSVNYDETALNLVDSQNGEALSSLAFQEPSKYANGCNFVWYGSKTGDVIDGEMLILTFEIKGDARPGTYPVTISWNDRDIYDDNCDMIDPKVEQGAIVIS